MILSHVRSFILAALLGLAVLGWAQPEAATAPTAQPKAVEDPLLSLAKSKDLPLTMEVGDLTDDYAAFKVSVEGVSSSTDFLNSIMGISMVSMRSADADSSTALQLLGMGDVIWTQGKTMKLDGQDYLVTYKLDIGLADMMAMSAKGAQPKSPQLRLNLVKRGAITSIMPRPDLKKEVVNKLVEDFAKLAAKTSGGAPIAVPAEAPGRDGPKPEAPEPANPKDVTINNAKQLALGMMLYTSDYDDVMPYPQSTKALQYVTRPYLKNDALWKTYNPNGGAFVFNMCIGGVATQSIPEPANTPMYYDSVAWPDGGRVVAFADGHVKYVSASGWKSLASKLKLKLKRVAKPLPLKYGLADKSD